jgi:hypothetical protein
MKPKPDDKLSITIVCREVDNQTGNVAVYKILDGATDNDIHILRIREVMNQELKYFAGVTFAVNDRWEDIEHELSQREFFLDSRLLVSIRRS